MKRIIGFIICLLIVLTIPVCATTEAEVEVEAELPITEVEVELTLTDTIVEWVKTNFEGLSIIISIIAYAVYEMKKHGKLNLSMNALNNNAINMATASADTIKQALAEVKDIADIVTKYKEEFESLLGEVRKTTEEKLTLEATLNNIETFLKTSKLAMIEVSNEVAELLVLANIPNSKKDELYARHMKAVHELEAAEEVTSNDGKEE